MKKWLLVVAVLFLAAGGIWLYRWWQSPAESILVSTNQTEQDVLGTESNLLPWQTSYFSTNYPDSFRVLTRNEVERGNVLGQYLLGSISARQTDQLAITVGHLQNEELSELSAVQFRTRESAEYQPTTRDFAPTGSFVFSKLSSYETSIYWRQDDRYVAVVVSGSSVRKAELESALQAVVTNWIWR